MSTDVGQSINGSEVSKLSVAIHITSDVTLLATAYISVRESFLFSTSPVRSPLMIGTDMTGFLPAICSQPTAHASTDYSLYLTLPA